MAEPLKGTGAPSGEGRVWYDVSPAISPRAAVFPGDTAYSRDVALDFARGDNLVLSAIHGTVHVGAHADAPSHYHPRGQPIDQRPLERYYGPCQVVSVRLPRGQRLLAQHLAGVEILAPRVLFHTSSFPDPDHWNGDFNALSAGLVDALAARGVGLVGIDTPSIDLAEDKALESHNAVFRNDLAVLEGLVLDGVPDGLYTLIALPLRLEGADASPVRAALLAEPSPSAR